MDNVSLPLDFAAAGCCGYWLEVVLGYLAAKGVSVNSEQFGRVGLVVPRLLESFLDGLTLDVLEVEGAEGGLEGGAVRKQALVVVGSGCRTGVGYEPQRNGDHKFAQP